MTRPPSRAGLAAAAAGVWLLSGCGLVGAPPAPPPAGDIGRGQLLLAQYQCGSCHAIPQVPASRGQVGASLEAFGRRSYIAGRLTNAPQILARWIESPQSLVTGTAMPDMGVTPADAQDMAAYLLSLR